METGNVRHTVEETRRTGTVGKHRRRRAKAKERYCREKAGHKRKQKKGLPNAKGKRAENKKQTE